MAPPRKAGGLTHGGRESTSTRLAAAINSAESTEVLQKGSKVRRGCAVLPEEKMSMLYRMYFQL